MIFPWGYQVFDHPSPAKHYRNLVVENGCARLDPTYPSWVFLRIASPDRVLHRNEIRAMPQLSRRKLYRRQNPLDVPRLSGLEILD